MTSQMMSFGRQRITSRSGTSLQTAGRNSEEKLTLDLAGSDRGLSLVQRRMLQLPEEHAEDGDPDATGGLAETDGTCGFRLY